MNIFSGFSRNYAQQFWLKPSVVKFPLPLKQEAIHIKTIRSSGTKKPVVAISRSRPVSRFFGKLLRSVRINKFFEFLTGLEVSHAFRGNIHRCSGFRVPSFS